MTTGHCASLVALWISVASAARVQHHRHVRFEERFTADEVGEKPKAHGVCVIEGPPDSGLMHKTGYPQGSCLSRCMSSVYKRREKNSSIRVFEEDFVNAFNASTSTGMCRCFLKKTETSEARQVLPTYMNLEMCTPLHCWMYYKKVFDVEMGVNAWRVSTTKCTEHCTPGVDCEEVTVTKGIDDQGVRKLEAEAKKSDSKRRQLRRITKAFGPIKLAPLQIREEEPAPKLQEKCEWRLPEPPYRCSKPCDDGSKNFTSVVLTPKVCFCAVGDAAARQVAADRCAKIPEDTTPVPCKVEKCRAAWEVLPVPVAKRPAFNDPYSVPLPLDGAWTVRGQPWSLHRIMIFGTTLSTMTIRKLAQPSAATRELPVLVLYGGQIKGTRLAYAASEDGTVVMHGEYMDASDTIVWAHHAEPQVTWVRVSAIGEEEILALDGAWVSEEHQQRRGHFSGTTSSSSTFTSWSADLQTEMRDEVDISAGVVTKVECSDAGVFHSGHLLVEDGIEKIVWAGTGFGGEKWVRAPEVVRTFQGWGPCSMKCMTADDEANQKEAEAASQTRQLACTIESPPNSGVLVKVDEAQCRTLLSDLPAPPATRRCFPRPTLCKDWHVVAVCKDMLTGETVPDSDCDIDRRPQLPQD